LQKLVCKWKNSKCSTSSRDFINFRHCRISSGRSAGENFWC